MPAKLIQLLVQAIGLYGYLLMILVLGSWFPQFHGAKLYRWIYNVTSPYANLFRGVIPPIGGFDFSIVFAFMLLKIIQDFLQNSLNSI